MYIMHYVSQTIPSLYNGNGNFKLRYLKQNFLLFWVIWASAGKNMLHKSGILPEVLQCMKYIWHLSSQFVT